MNTELKDNKKTIIYGKKEYNLCKYIFGVLEMDYNSPLCCVSEANNSFSIDYFKGCPFQCAYCHVQGNFEDLNKDYKMLPKTVPRSNFTIDQIVDALINHKYFEKDRSVISIATSSTEPFANPDVTENTLKIMEYFVSLGYKNPFWIVTKAGIPKIVSKRLKKICDHGNKVMISICWANNPSEIEPARNNRFMNIETLKETGVCVSWYLRPLVREWSANYKSLEQTIKYVSEKYGEYIDMIVPGGLRWTEGIEFGLHVIRGIKMPKLQKKHNKKTLSAKIEKNIIKLCEYYFPGKPVYFNSSCAISHMLNRSNIALVNLFDQNVCKKSKCCNSCKKYCQNYNFTNKDLEKIEKNLHNQGISIKFNRIDYINKIDSIPKFDSFNYTEKQQIKKTIASTLDKERIKI